MSDLYSFYSHLLGRYSDFDDSICCKFKYDNTDKRFEILKEKYKIDKIAGNGDELSKVLNLLSWVHNGSFHSPEVKKLLPYNALTLLEYSYGKGPEYGVNCSMLSSILTGAYLGISLKARTVWLHPKNHDDLDCHAVTIVWLESKKKWIMVDPTFNSYLLDKDNNIQSPWEARQIIAKQEFIKCNDDIGYNGKKYSMEEKNGYIKYLAKNFFYMHSPLITCFDIEALPEQKWIFLTPKDFNAKEKEVISAKLRIRYMHKCGNLNYDLLGEIQDCINMIKNSSIFTNSLVAFALKPE